MQGPSAAFLSYTRQRRGLVSCLASSRHIITRSLSGPQPRKPEAPKPDKLVILHDAAELLEIKRRLPCPARYFEPLCQTPALIQRTSPVALDPQIVRVQDYRCRHLPRGKHPPGAKSQGQELARGKHSSGVGTHRGKRLLEAGIRQGPPAEAPGVLTAVSPKLLFQAPALVQRTLQLPLGSNFTCTGSRSREPRGFLPQWLLPFCKGDGRANFPPRGKGWHKQLQGPLCGCETPWK